MANTGTPANAAALRLLSEAQAVACCQNINIDHALIQHSHKNGAGLQGRGRYFWGAPGSWCHFLEMFSSYVPHLCRYPLRSTMEPKHFAL